MKKIIIAVILALLCIPAFSQKKSYIIKGTVEQLNPEIKLIFNDWGIRNGVEIVEKRNL